MAIVAVPLPTDRINDLRRVAARRRVHTSDLAARILTDWLDSAGADELLAAYEEEIRAVRERAQRDVAGLVEKGAQQRLAG